jgi:hypothetical protein
VVERGRKAGRNKGCSRRHSPGLPGTLLPNSKLRRRVEIPLLALFSYIYTRAKNNLYVFLILIDPSRSLALLPTTKPPPSCPSMVSPATPAGSSSASPPANHPPPALSSTLACHPRTWTMPPASCGHISLVSCTASPLTARA